MSVTTSVTAPVTGQAPTVPSTVRRGAHTPIRPLVTDPLRLVGGVRNERTALMPHPRPVLPLCYGVTDESNTRLVSTPPRPWAPFRSSGLSNSENPRNSVTARTPSVGTPTLQTA